MTPPEPTAAAKAYADGPELDALMAEKVMGWHRDYSLSQTHSKSWRDASNNIMAQVNVGDELGGWSPSTDIVAAWQVVEKMRADGWIVKIEMASRATEPYTDCRFWRWVRGVISEAHNARADTAPRAICRAAALAPAEGSGR